MSDDTRVQQLLEEIMDSGRTPADVCRSCPELLPTVIDRLRRLQALDAEMTAMFPSRAQDPPWLDGESSDQECPTIPGYTVLGLLGRGGMGVVYKARHLKLARDVAVKMLLTGKYAGPAELTRFMREAQAIAGLRHPHIIQVYDVGDLDGRPFFTMEYVEGGSLAQKLGGVPQPARYAAEMTATLAEAIQAAHVTGLVHRDVKPANILLTGDGTPKISDFGLARSFTEGSDVTLGGARVGTPCYMSPEQAMGHPGAAVGPSTDIYSLGAVLYEMLTGRPPFRAETPAETERQVISDEPAAPSRLNAKVPRDLEIICLKCLRKEPQRRYTSASALAADLHRFLRGEPIAARPIGRLERLAKWARRHPGRTAGWVAGTAAAGAVLSSFLWIASQRATLENAVREDLAEAVKLERAAEWRAARNMLERARTRLDAGSTSGASALNVQAAAVERDLNLVDRLTSMRLERGAAQSLEFDPNKWWDSYRQAFMDAGMLQDGDSPTAFAERISQSPIRAALVEAMDDWAICARDEEKLNWLLMTTRAADPGSEWRQRARDLSVWKDPAAMLALAREAPVESEPVALLLSIAGILFQLDPDASVAMLRKVQAAHPGDFWTNFALADMLERQQHADALGFYRAAVACRPEASAAHFNMAIVLSDQGREDEAIAAYRIAISLDPNNWTPHYNLARLLMEQNRLDEALEHARRARQLAPKEVFSHVVLAMVLRTMNRHAEAAASFRSALELIPLDDDRRRSIAARVTECEAAAAAELQSTSPNP